MSFEFNSTFRAMLLSIVVNTANRPETLANTLDALTGLGQSDVEIVVVDQSKDDGTRILCEKYAVRYFKSQVMNLSISRNIGIREAQGQIVAFIDDDAIPGADWFAKIKANFANDPQMSVLAGKVINKNIDMLQFRNGIVSDQAYIDDIRDLDGEKYSRGFEHWYLRPMGTNMSFRKTALQSVGGFDEFYEYTHDETDVTLRIVKKGGKVVYDDTLLVNHYTARSHNRQGEYGLNWYVEAKNNAYFVMKNSPANFFLRVIQAKKRVLWKNGPMLSVWRLWKEGKVGGKFWLESEIKVFVGLFRGIFGYIIRK